MRYRRHVFVCTNERPPGGKPSCGGRGGADVAAALQRAIAASPQVGEIAVTPCGCLGPCFDGPVAVVYPDGTWLGGLAPGDAPAVAAWLAGTAQIAPNVLDVNPDDED